jgi:hypothetical protein
MNTATFVSIQVIETEICIAHLRSEGLDVKENPDLDDEIVVDITDPAHKAKLKAWMLDWGGWDQDEIDSVYPEVN